MQKTEDIKQLDLNIKAKLVTGGSFWSTKECPEIGLKSVKLSDGPHGMRVQKGRPSHLGIGGSLPATCYPTASATACTFNLPLIKQLGEHIAREAASFGVAMVLGPGLNIKRSPLCGRNFEYFSEDSYLSGKLAAAYVEGMQQTGVTACIKHFVVNNREYARMFCDSRVDEQTLREIYLTGFEIAVKEGGARAVMSAYNSVNGVHCNQNEGLINGILRGEWAFGGLVVSDWGGSRGRVQALKAGADLEMPECRISAAEVVAAVQCGELDESVLDKSVQRICQFAARADKIDTVPFDVDEHDQFAQKVAEESIVLLKNQDCALPLSDTERVAVIGDFAKTPRYQGAGSSQIIPTSLSNILGAIEQSGLNYVGFARGFERFGGENKKLFKAALKLVERCDTAIVCIGLDEDKECEGLDRSNLRIDDNQVELLTALAKTGKKIVAVLSCGSAVETEWDCNVNALLLAHLGGQSGARAVVNVLTGKINPSGKLAESYPVKLADVPCSEIYSASPYKSDYAEGIFVGYRYYNTFDIPVKYPFGYGLSYTQFTYSGFKVDDGGVCVTVTNNGERDGAEVVQVYVKAPRPDMPASPSELKLFTKVFLRSGESKQVVLPYDEYTFRTWNSRTHRFEAGGVYEISVNADSLRKIFTARYEVTPDNLPKGCAFAETCEKSEITFKEYFESRLTPDEPHEVSKKLVAHLDMQVADLIYCKGLVAKIFGTIAKMYKKSEDKLMAMAFDWLRVRSLLQFMNLTSVQAEGFILACNGHFFKGMRKLLSKKY